MSSPLALSLATTSAFIFFALVSSGSRDSRRLLRRSVSLTTSSTLVSAARSSAYRADHCRATPAPTALFAPRVLGKASMLDEIINYVNASYVLSMSRLGGATNALLMADMSLKVTLSANMSSEPWRGYGESGNNYNDYDGNGGSDNSCQPSPPTSSTTFIFCPIFHMYDGPNYDPSLIKVTFGGSSTGTDDLRVIHDYLSLTRVQLIIGEDSPISC
uniref:Uncharacterized protein n=1 Tax=Oryza brachyantha TaxID=4533 RepID=J3LQN8_ORYBR